MISKSRTGVNAVVGKKCTERCPREAVDKNRTKEIRKCFAGRLKGGAIR